MIILVTYGLTRVVNAFMSELGQGAIRFSHFEPEWAPFTSRIINFLLVVGAVVVASPTSPAQTAMHSAASPSSWGRSSPSPPRRRSPTLSPG